MSEPSPILVSREIVNADTTQVKNYKENGTLPPLSTKPSSPYLSLR